MNLINFSKNATSVLITLSLALFLSGCAATHQTKVIKQYPPDYLLKKTEAPQFTGKTWADLYRYTAETHLKIQECNDNIQGIIDWIYRPLKDDKDKQLEDKR